MKNRTWAVERRTWRGSVDPAYPILSFFSRFRSLTRRIFASLLSFVIALSPVDVSFSYSALNVSNLQVQSRFKLIVEMVGEEYRERAEMEFGLIMRMAIKGLAEDDGAGEYRSKLNINAALDKQAAGFARAEAAPEEKIFTVLDNPVFTKDKMIQISLSSRLNPGPQECFTVVFGGRTLEELEVSDKIKVITKSLDHKDLRKSLGVEWFGLLESAIEKVTGLELRKNDIQRLIGSVTDVEYLKAKRQVESLYKYSRVKVTNFNEQAAMRMIFLHAMGNVFGRENGIMLEGITRGNTIFYNSSTGSAQLSA
ncbi:MAG: hypothetical protein HQL30_07685, partial [Candidatus Omnitrophica bacterium]|nr:hypothetical protein [Candidatus Omnitrophota bacterium]